MKRLKWPLAFVGVCLLAQSPAPRGAVVYCNPPAVACQQVPLGPGLSFVNGTLTATGTTVSVSVRKYGVALAWNGNGWSGIPATAGSVALFVNGLRQYADAGDYTINSAGFVTLPDNDPTWSVRADYDAQ